MYLFIIDHKDFTSHYEAIVWAADENQALNMALNNFMMDPSYVKFIEVERTIIRVRKCFSSNSLPFVFSASFTNISAKSLLNIDNKHLDNYTKVALNKKSTYYFQIKLIKRATLNMSLFNIIKL